MRTLKRFIAWLFLDSTASSNTTVGAREAVAVEELRTRYYPDLAMPFEDFEWVWKEIARVFGVDPGRMRPEDRFGVELPYRKTLFGMTDEDIDLGGSFARRWKGLNFKQKERIRHVDDLVRLVERQVSHRRSSAKR